MTVSMSEPAPPTLDVRRRRLLYRATHRGTYENDLMIGGYVRHTIAGMTDSEMDALEAVMELPDSDLADWLTGRTPIPPEHDCPTLQAIRTFAREPRNR
jgi:antitoxin CptB